MHDFLLVISLEQLHEAKLPSNMFRDERFSNQGGLGFLGGGERMYLSVPFCKILNAD